MAPIADKMREPRFKKFGHIKRSSMNAPMRRCEIINLLECKRGRGQSKKSLNKIVRHDLKFSVLRKDMAQHKSMRRSRIKVMDHR